MAESNTTPSTLSDVIEELDRAICENLAGLTAGQCEAGSSEASVYELRGLLYQQWLQNPDLDLNSIPLEFTRVPVQLPPWVPRAITDGIGLTVQCTASEALASAIRDPTARNHSDLTSAIERAT